MQMPPLNSFANLFLLTASVSVLPMPRTRALSLLGVPLYYRSRNVNNREDLSKSKTLLVVRTELSKRQLFFMKHIDVIPEIFSLLDTALLSAYSSGSKEPAQTARKWLIENRHAISDEAYKLLNSFALKKKGFNIYLKKWLSQYAERRAFVLSVKGKTDEEWVMEMCRSWERAGGVFFTGGKDTPASLTKDVIKAAQSKGVITLLDRENNDGCFTFEIAMSSERQYHGIISHFDKCGVPISKNERNKKGLTFLITNPPTQNILNKVVAETMLPYYAEKINGIKRI